LSAAGALVENAKNTVITNNIANLNTTGFKNDFAVFRARASESVEDSQPAYATLMDPLGGGVVVSGTYTRHTQGPINVTGNPLDLAINGEGYFAVSDGEDVLLTRAGAFMRDDEGRLVTPDGRHYLSDLSGTALRIPLGSDISIADDGTITVDGATCGAVGVYEPLYPSALEKVGSNLYRDRAGAAELFPYATVKQGALEGSTVSPADEISQMILASRSYEMNMQMIRLQDQTLADLMGIARVTM